MLFNSIEFAFFFPAVVGMYWATYRYRSIQNLILIGASYVFYGWWDPRFLVLIAVSTTTDHWSGIGVSGQKFLAKDYLNPIAFLLGLLTILALLGVRDVEWIAVLVLCYAVAMIIILKSTSEFSIEIRKKIFLYTSIVVNLSILGFFKYFNFFAESFEAFVQNFGWSPGFVTLSIVLPVGISFYTFQTMSYTLDIYRGALKPAHRFADLVAYVSFFPQLVAGPIERALHLLPQFERDRSITRSQIASGIGLFLWGLYKKIVIADNIAPLADYVFSNPDAVTRGETIIGVVAFAFQIYCDFSGYSDMARGSARLLGFDVMVNFRFPYIAKTPSEFWRRWHISLSTWLRDYLYIPLGGNRGTSFATYRNLILTMGLGGLWHGASWTFVVWGIFHGIILAVYRALRIDALLQSVSLRQPRGLMCHVVAMVVMFTLVCAGWVFFRSQTLTDAISVLSRAFEPIAFGASFTTLATYILPFSVMEYLFSVTQREEWGDPALRWFASLNLYLFITCSLIFLSSSGGQEFIYFDF